MSGGMILRGYMANINVKIPDEWLIEKDDSLCRWIDIIRMGLDEQHRIKDRELYVSLEKPVKKLSSSYV